MLNTDSVLILSSDECGALSLFETDLYVLNRVKSTNVFHQSYFNCSTHISRRAGLFGPRHLIATHSFMLHWKQSPVTAIICHRDHQSPDDCFQRNETRSND